MSSATLQPKETSAFAPSHLAAVDQAADAEPEHPCEKMMLNEPTNGG